ncbi:hypothetical protein J9303_16035, partial [Bacillaceae bacterium Marseille-Q3522]|nr:hypothetical protein [Bacillaceae bacterium Marseille-Q3522]
GIYKYFIMLRLVFNSIAIHSFFNKSFINSFEVGNGVMTAPKLRISLFSFRYTSELFLKLPKCECHAKIIILSKNDVH